MNPRPRLKSHASATGQPSPAETAPPTAAGSAPKIAARQGALSSVRPDPHPASERNRAA